jgi:4-methylaminobutanoate oxidase (formaldehyde-forming)
MGRQNWFGPVGEEHAHVREAVGIFDQSSFAKYELTGKDAQRALDWICANDVNKPAGRLTYTQLLNTRGGIEADLTVARLSDEKFYIVTGTGFRTHDLAWIGEHIGDGFDARLTDVTEQFGTLSLMGPSARKVLEAVTDADVSNGSFPFGHVREITIAGQTVRALRVTYVGELGWDLHVPIDATGEVFDALMTAGKAYGIRPVGYRAMESLRLEKGYRAWGADITPNDTPFEAGLGWAVKLRKNTDFLGRKALEKANGAALGKRLAGFTVDDPDIVLLGRETILRDGAPVGYLTSGGFGYTIGQPIGYGYVRNADGVSDAFIADGSYELVVAMQPVKARIHMQPLYDAAGVRVKS